MKKRRKSSTTATHLDEEEEDPEAVVTYLELVNDFIRGSLQDEMNEFLARPPQQESTPVMDSSPEVDAPQIEEQHEEV